MWGRRVLARHAADLKMAKPVQHPFGSAGGGAAKADVAAGYSPFLEQQAKAAAAEKANE